MTAAPPLLDLAFLNVEHWQSSSDQSNILHVARVPILFGTGIAQDTTLPIGAGLAIAVESTDSKLSYVEHSGAAIEAGRQSIKDIEDRMSIMGAQLLVRRKVAATATEKSIDNIEANCQLSAMAMALESAIELSLNYAGAWEGMADTGTVEIVTEFDDDQDGTITDLLKALELGVISQETCFAELQRRDAISDELTWLDELAKIKANQPPQKIQI
jgi:hypothetical protein